MDRVAEIRPGEIPTRFCLDVAELVVDGIEHLELGAEMVVTVIRPAAVDAGAFEDQQILCNPITHCLDALGSDRRGVDIERIGDVIRIAALTRPPALRDLKIAAVVDVEGEVDPVDRLLVALAKAQDGLVLARLGEYVARLIATGLATGSANREGPELLALRVMTTEGS